MKKILADKHVEIKGMIEQAISEKQRVDAEMEASRRDVSFAQPTTVLPRRLIEEEGESISQETLNFIVMVEDIAYPEEMKLIQDIEDVEDLADTYDTEVYSLTVARNNDWYIVCTEDDESIEIADIAALPERDREASRQEMYDYMTKVLNVKAARFGKNISLNAKEDTSYRMIQRMVRSGDYEIIEDTPNYFDYGETIQMHYLVLRPIVQRDIDRDR